MHWQELCPFDKHAIGGPTGTKFYHAASQQTPKKGELKDSSIQIFVSYSFSWLPYVGI
jgi:hypothetical protein